MPSVPTVPQPNHPRTTPRLSQFWGHVRLPAPVRPRSLLVAFATMIGLIALTGCASGNVNEARRGAAADLEGTPTLAQLQATRVAQQFKPATPVGTPDTRPMPTIEALVITLGLAPGNAPREQYAAVPADAPTVYADALMHDLRGGQTVTAEWVNASGNLIATSEASVPNDAAQAWVALPMQLAGSVPPGDYAVFVDVDGHLIDSLVFRVASPGTAQVLAPLPSNPQITDGDPSGSGGGSADDGEPPIEPAGDGAPVEEGDGETIESAPDDGSVDFGNQEEQPVDETE